MIDFIQHLLYLGTPKALNKAVSECDAAGDSSGKHCVSTGPAARASCAGPAARGSSLAVRVQPHGSRRRGPVTHTVPAFRLSRGLTGQVTTIFGSVSSTQRKKDTRKDTQDRCDQPLWVASDNPLL